MRVTFAGEQKGDQMPELRVKPGRWYYVLAGLVFGAGLAAFGVLIFSGLSSLTGGLTQVVVPGQHELILPETGAYTVFHEYRSVVGNKMYSMAPGGISGLQCSLASKATGEQIPLSRSTMNSTYSMGSRSGASVFGFRIDSPGTYVFSAQYPPGEEGPEAVLSVGHGFVKQLLVTILGGLAIMFGTVGAAAAIAVTTFVKRRRARNRPQEGAETLTHFG
jgi:hypothetical protein